MEVITRSLALPNGSTLSIETGRLARQADGSVMLRVNDVMILATVCAKKTIDPKIDFLPLTVDYKEHYASTGKIPGGFLKRDGRSNEFEILTSRIVDRSLRPMFPEDYHGDIQVIISLFSGDKDTQPDALACVAASAALMVSDIPFPDPISTVRVGYKDGKYLINPTFAEAEGSLMDIIVAGSMDSIVMVEGEMLEISEEIMLGGLKAAHDFIKQINTVLLDLRAAAGKPTRSYEKPFSDDNITARVNELAANRVKEICYAQSSKTERSEKFDAILEEISTQIMEELVAAAGETPLKDDEKSKFKSYIAKQYEEVKYAAMREMILADNKRLDGRTTVDIRPIWCQTSYLPRAHGSALFTRGETQSLTTVTLGTKLDEQMIDYATLQTTKKFMLQYIFPPYSTGEVKPLRAPARREVGHGNLAERALKNMIPADIEYTLRIVSEILESNGSSSMATVCAGSMALMDAGIKIKSAVSGIAMGLIVEGDRFAVLSDILGDEDHLGDMDFKTTGTAQGLTACQMDIKVRGLSFEILSKALNQAKDGRMHILGKLNEEISQPRGDYSPFAPRIIKIDVPLELIGAIIGPGGKIIQEMQRTSGAVINIEEIGSKGEVTIASPNKDSLDLAYNKVMAIIAQPEPGKTYRAKVRNIREAGAFLEFMPGKDGWLHVSEWSNERINSMEDVMSLGDEMDVLLLGMDPKTNRWRLSRKALLEGYDPNAPKTSGGGGNFNRNDRNDNRGGGNFNRNDRNDNRGGGFRNDRNGGGGGNFNRNDRNDNRGGNFNRNDRNDNRGGNFNRNTGSEENQNVNVENNNSNNGDSNE